MNKQELQAMIDSTIVPNKKKGITAESLRLVLNEMATATPEGSGLGLLRFWIYSESISELTQEQIDENIATYNSLLSGETVGLLLCYEYSGDYFGEQYAAIPAMSLALVSEKYGNVVGAYFDLIDPFALKASLAAIEFHPDGTAELFIAEDTEQTSADLVKRIWIEEAVGLEPSEEHLAENKATYEFFKNGGDAVVLACYKYEDVEKLSSVCDRVSLLGGEILVCSVSFDDNYYAHISNTIGFEIEVNADGHIEATEKRSGYLKVYVPSEGEELTDVYKGYNKEVFNIIAYGDVPSPIMIEWDDTTYTSASVRFGTINEEIGQAAIIGFFRGTTNVMSVVCILSDGTAMEV